MNSSNPAQRRTTPLKRGLLLFLATLLLAPPAYALSPPHHLYNISRRLVEVVGAPFYAIFYSGPKKMKEAYRQEVWEQEKPKHNGKFRYKLKALPRALGEELKAAIDGVTGSVSSAGEAAKEFVSIFLSD
jgi:hypothetical protein